MNCILPVTIALGCGAASATTLSFTAFQYPGSIYTVVRGINDNGDIVGSYSDSHGGHGFLQSSTGMLNSFDFAAQIPTGPAISTIPSGINDAGQIVGSYGGYPYNAFVRDSKGNNISASNAAFTGITDSGLVTGYTLAGFQDFIIDATGHYTYFTVPYLVAPFLSTFAWGINKSGVVVGSYTGIIDGGFGVGSFIRDAAGHFTRFDVPGANATIATGINDNGDIVGYYSMSNTYRGFLRSPHGTIQLLDFPGAGSTELHGINNSGQVVGLATINGITEGIVSAPLSLPEPSDWTTVTIGLIVLATIPRRTIRT